MSYPEFPSTVPPQHVYSVNDLVQDAIQDYLDAVKDGDGVDTRGRIITATMRIALENYVVARRPHMRLPQNTPSRGVGQFGQPRFDPIYPIYRHQPARLWHSARPDE